MSNFSQNNLGVNLRLTALVSKLASFPHPLLKAVLLHPDVVVQPACRTLIQAICMLSFFIGYFVKHLDSQVQLGYG